VGRALLNAPHEVLLDQAVTLSTRLPVLDDGLASMRRLGIDVDGLLAELSAIVPSARAARLRLLQAKVDHQALAADRAAWLTSLGAWVASLRGRLGQLRAPHQAPAVAEVRSRLPRYAGRQFARSIEALRETLQAVRDHEGVLGSAAWVPDLVPEGDSLAGAAAALQVAEASAAAAVTGSSATVVQSRKDLQDLLRRVRAAWDVTRLAHPGLSALRFEVLEAYAPRTRSAAPRNSESGPIPSESGPIPSESGTLPREPGPLPSKSGPLTSEPGPLTSEPGIVTSESGTLTRVYAAVMVSQLPVTPSPLPVMPSALPVMPTTLPVMPADLPVMAPTPPVMPADLPVNPSDPRSGDRDPPC
jgi:hypothetical protein